MTPLTPDSIRATYERIRPHIRRTPILEVDGVSAGVLHVPTLKPVDRAAIVEATDRVALVVTVEEHTVFGGLGGLIAEILGERSPRRIVRIGIEDTWGESASNDDLLDMHRLSATRVAERVLAELRVVAAGSRR